MPLLLLHHGTGGTGEELVRMWMPLATRHGIVLAAIKGEGRYGWEVPSDGPELQIKVAEQLRKELPIDERRIYLFGFSNGGDFVLYAAVQQSEYFAGACVHQASLRARQFPLLELPKRKVPLWYSVGDKDEVYPLRETRPTAAELTKRGWPMEHIERTGEGHGVYLDSVNEGCWRFIGKHKLAGDPKATPLTREWLEYALK